MVKKRKEAPFDLKAWLKETLLYLAFLFAFTFGVFGGRPAMLMVAYERIWRDAAKNNIAMAK
jgi:hypothetical protein